MDATAPGAVWNVRRTWIDEPSGQMAWTEILEVTRGSFDGNDIYGAFEGLGFVRSSPGTYSAIDGVRVSNR